MGASESKLGFKHAVFRLAEKKKIATNDPFWAEFWQLPESADDVFSLFSPTDIRRVRDESLPNLETLLLAVSSHLFALRRHPAFPDAERAPEREALNCIRILTRLLPYIHEDEKLNDWEDNIFWNSRSKSEILFDEAHERQHSNASEDSKTTEDISLAAELINVLIELLFFADFTLPKTIKGQKVTFAIWQSGVGCNSPVGTSREFESNRSEILRLLLALSGKAMYTSANVLPLRGVRTITYLTINENKQIVLTLLCSLLNTTLKYNPATWRVPYDHVVLKDPKQTLVAYCLQLLLVLVLYPVPESSSGILFKNSFRHFLGRLHRAQDFQFLVDGMSRILNQPLQASTAYLPGSQKPLTWAPEMIMLFWEIVQCNKRFRSFIVDTDRAHDFMILILFQAVEHKDDPARQVSRMCIFLLQTLSVEASFGKRLNKVFEGQESLPQSIRLPVFRGSYADYLVVSLYNLMSRSNRNLDAIYPAILAIINNIAPYMRDLNATTSTKLLQLFSWMSSPSFLLANESNHVLLQSLLEAINAILEHQYESNAVFVLALLRAQKRFRALRSFTLDGAQMELERQAFHRKASGVNGEEGLTGASRGTSFETSRSTMSTRNPSVSTDDEENAFVIGDEDDEEAGTEVFDAQTRSNDSSTDVTHTTHAPSFDRPVEDALPAQLGGMSEKARGKLKAGQDAFPRQGSYASLTSLGQAHANGRFEASAAWIETWLPDLPMHTTLALLDHLIPIVPVASLAASSSSNSSEMNANSSATRSGLSAIRRAPAPQFLVEPPAENETSNIRVHLFEWSPLSVGWYESLLWGFIFAGELALARGGTGGGAGVWKGTRVRLFRVQEAPPPPRPSLMAPRGAVDAVGSNLVQKLGGLGLGRVANGAAAASNGHSGATGRQ